MEDINRGHSQNREQKLASSERMIRSKKKHDLTWTIVHEVRPVFIVHLGRKVVKPKHASWSS